MRPTLYGAALIYTRQTRVSHIAMVHAGITLRAGVLALGMDRELQS